MSIEELARSAATDLQHSVAQQVSVAAARGDLSRRVRRRRVEHGLVTALCLVLVVGGAALVVRPQPERALPAGVPTVVPTASPASDCLFRVTCKDGTYRAALTIPTTFSPQGVLDVGSDTASVLDLDEPNGVYGVTVVANPRGTDPGFGATPGVDGQTLVEWLTTRSDLVVQPRGLGTVGGRSALVVDVTPTPEASFSWGCQSGQADCLPLFAVDAPAGSPSKVWIARGQTIRVLLVDVPEAGTVAVLVRDSTTSGYAPAVAMAQVATVLDSFAFGED